MIIALIEDDEPQRELTKESIRREIPDATFEEFWMVELALESETKWDCVLLDLWLPRTRGIQTFRSLAAGRPGVPIIILTGSSDVEIAKLATIEGAANFIIKEERINSKNLALSIRLAIFKHELKNTQKICSSVKTMLRGDSLDGE